MKFPLTERLLAEARQFGLRSACCDCFFWRVDRKGAGPLPAGEAGRAPPPRLASLVDRKGAGPLPAGEAGRAPPPRLASLVDRAACAHDWPDEGQRRWPLDAPDPDGSRPTEVAFCKEFELR